MNISVYLNSLRLKGNLAYEYNPLHNYQTDENLYLINDKYVVPEGKAVNPKNGEILTKKIVLGLEGWYDKRGRKFSNEEEIILAGAGSPWASAGSIIDLDTDKLNFDLNHPVDIEVLPSYDGSVNLILNDDKNIPRLINSRFSAREKNTYEIVDRIGENDSNIYNSRTFDKDTSLYFQYEFNPTVEYLGFVKGVLPVGLYCFYFTYCDVDDNESDIIAESGLIPAFIGNDRDPSSMDGGIKNQSSDKGIRIKLSNLDSSYNYIKVYYVRYFADYGLNRVYEGKKLYKKYPLNGDILYLQITGYEEAEDIDPNILNISRFNPKSVLTLALCKNMLFFGNIVKNTDDYKELLDLALRISPTLKVTNETFDLTNDYSSIKGDYEYYNSINIYNKTGYFNKEYYRFGVVFIYYNGTLSNVYNTLGGTLKKLQYPKIKKEIAVEENGFYKRNYVNINDKGWVIDGYEGENVNAKGVCYIDWDKESINNKISIEFNISKSVSDYLKELGIRGLFFVRLKCTPTLITLCYIFPMDEQLKAPVLIDNNDEYYAECFVTLNKDGKGSGRYLKNDYESRLYKIVADESISNKAYAGICPDFLLNQPYYNLIFNGGEFRILEVNKSTFHKRDSYGGRFYDILENLGFDSGIERRVNICSVTEDVPTVAIKDLIYKLEMGQTEEAYRFEYVGKDSGIYNAGDADYDAINEATNIVRGKYSPYLAIYSNNYKLEPGLYNIYPSNKLNISQEFQIRMDSTDPFYAISDRVNLGNNDFKLECWRGDCYLNQFTYRLNRNFNDPSLPNNDKIIDKNTWRDNYDVKDSTKWENISRSDINAVRLGSWITFRIKSAMNYALRSVDHSYVSEENLMGAPRSFYPRSTLLERGENKMPDSYLYNDAYRASLGFKCYFTLSDVNYIKNTFSNRIQYSAISILDSFKNNYRYSLSTYFRDYSQEYGSILKLVGFEGYILVIFEHGIGIAVVNERVLAGGGEGEPVFINTQNVLPEELTIITDTYGTLWPESVVKSEAGYVYGLDTIAKKIWRIKGQLIEILSDFKVNKFLIDNITLGENELYPIVGLKNVKTHYNNNKKDIIFTFYDDVYKDEEKVWSLCYNELLGLFITFYSWIPSYSANIDTKFFSFDRNTSKELSLLLKCNYSIPENTGVVLDGPVISNSVFSNPNYYPTLYYVSPTETCLVTYTVINLDNTTSLKTLSLDTTQVGGHNILEGVKFKIERDHWNNYKHFSINGTNQIVFANDVTETMFNLLKVIILYITPYLESSDNRLELGSATLFPTEMVAFTLSSIVNNPLLTLEEKTRAGLTTDFYLHGQAGIFNVVENLYPTYWYGEFHPFEFEFVVNDKIGLQKIFSNLVLIANKAEPESFHFEIEGDNYEFSLDKRNMYFRLEATKNLYLNLGSNILYNRHYPDVAASKYTLEEKVRPLTNGEVILSPDLSEIPIYKDYPIHYQEGLVLQVKSTIFPLYYERIDTYNDVYHKYHLMLSSDGMYDFLNLSGSEISWDRDLNQFNIVTHIKNSPINLVGILRGNSQYKEGKWNIQIPSITFMLKNEPRWPLISEANNALTNDSPISGMGEENIPPIVVNSQYVPKDLDKSNVGVEDLPNIYTGRMNFPDENIEYNIDSPARYIDTSLWTARKEARIRDKWMKVRVRYSGKNLAIIHSLVTLYNLSYS